VLLLEALEDFKAPIRKKLLERFEDKKTPDTSPKLGLKRNNSSHSKLVSTAAINKK
jgi:hypothetical protein